jgi:hypothetical protein
VNPVGESVRAELGAQAGTPFFTRAVDLKILGHRVLLWVPLGVDRSVDRMTAIRET